MSEPCTTTFLSDDPLDHLHRALNELRRMGFTLMSAAVTCDEAAAACGADGQSGAITLTYRPRDDFSGENYLDRLRGMPGVWDLVSRPLVAEPHLAPATVAA